MTKTNAVFNPFKQVQFWILEFWSFVLVSNFEFRYSNLIAPIPVLELIKINLKYGDFNSERNYNLPDSSFLRKKPICLRMELFAFIPRSMHFMECSAVA